MPTVAGRMGGMCSSEDAPPVMAAVLSNDADEVQKALAKPGVDINEKDEVQTASARAPLRSKS